MRKDDLAQAFTRNLDASGESIVNPRCDECNTPLSTPHPSQIGLPRLCTICTMLVHRESQIRFREYQGQERPRGRSVHVVKLPKGFK